MSAYAPPTYYFNGIKFDSAYFATSGTGLTEGQANILYLRKNVADTANGLTTFNGGLNVAAINAISATGNIYIGQSATSGNLQLGTGVSGFLQIGSSSSTTTVNGAGVLLGSSGTSDIGFMAPLNLNYYTVQPTAAQLGYTTGNLSPFGIYTCLLANTAYVPFAFNLPSAGTWLIKASGMVYSFNGGSNIMSIPSTPTGNSINFSAWSNVIAPATSPGNGPTLNIVTPVYISSAGTWNLVLYTGVANSTINNIFVYATRIA